MKPSEFSVLIAIISGVFAFFGAVFGQVVGQLLNRRTQRETWLLQKRAEVFSKFMSDFAEYDRKCTIIDEGPGDTVEGAREKAAAFDYLKISRNIVCLYLSTNDRIEFLSLFEKKLKFVPDFSSMGVYSPEKLIKCYQPLYDIEENLQSLFEKNIAKISWYN